MDARVKPAHDGGGGAMLRSKNATRKQKCPAESRASHLLNEIAPIARSD
jgi:hypothetical protein